MKRIKIIKILVLILIITKNINSNEFGMDVFNNSFSNVSVPDVKNSVKIENVAIYEENTMMDYYKVDKDLQKLADSTVAFVHKTRLKYDYSKNVYVPIKLPTLREMSYLSPNEDLGDQKTLSFCSGALVGENLILTAGHCISKEPNSFTHYSNVYVVFGWKQTDIGIYSSNFEKDDVYGIKSIVLRKLEDELDYAIVKLDRPVKNREILLTDRAVFLQEEGYKVFTIGYPAGMSVKITDPNDATIVKKGLFTLYAPLDHLAGNSGSPVFESSTKRIIGILVRGPSDYNWRLKEDIIISISEIEKILQYAGIDEKQIKKVVKNIIEIATSEGAHYNDNFLIYRKGYNLYDDSFSYKLITQLVGNFKSFVDETGALSVYPKDTSRLTHIQRLDKGITYYIPFTNEEKLLCDRLKEKIYPYPGIINANYYYQLYPLYKAYCIYDNFI